ncbi:hypothetical protein BCR34DRAFT_632435, partial [Clohesyomyces aquaticus]
RTVPAPRHPYPKPVPLSRIYIISDPFTVCKHRTSSSGPTNTFEVWGRKIRETSSAPPQTRSKLGATENRATSSAPPTCSKLEAEAAEGLIRILGSHQYLSGNGEGTSAIIPNGWPNNVANLFGRVYMNNREVYQCAKTEDVCYGDIPCSDNWSWNARAKRQVGPYTSSFAPNKASKTTSTTTSRCSVSQIHIQGMSAYLANNFFEKPDKAAVLFQEEFFNALDVVFSITGSYAKFIPIIASSNVRKETSGALGALLGGIGNGYWETISYPSDPVFENYANLGLFMTNDMQFNPGA